MSLTETKIKVGVERIYDLSLPEYKLYQTPTDGKGGALFYIKNHLDCKQRIDLEKKMYKSCELEISHS